MTAVRRCGISLVLAALAPMVALGLAPGAAGAQAVPGGPTAQAGLSCVTGEGEVATSAVLVVVAFPSGTFTRCVAPGGSGLDVLRAAGLAVEVQSFGAKGGAVCGITDPNGTFVGCADGPDCLTCPATNGGSQYWGYYRCYAYSQVGAGSTTPAGGTIEAWRFAGGGGWGGARPAECDDGRAPAPPPPPTPPPPTPPTPPPGGGGTPGGGSPGGGSSGGGAPGGAGATPGGGPGGGGAAPAPDDAAAPGSTAGPDGPGSTAPTSTVDAPTTTGPADEGADDETDEDDARAAEERADGVRDRSWVPRDGDDERADVVPASARSEAGGGGGAPVVPLVLTALVVAGVAALAIRARRHRTAPPPTPI